DAGGQADQQVVVIDLHPLLAPCRALETMAPVIADMLALLPVRDALALLPVTAMGSQALCLMTPVRGVVIRLAWLRRLIVMLAMARRAIIAALRLRHRDGEHGNCDCSKDRTLEHLWHLVSRCPQRRSRLLNRI